MKSNSGRLYFAFSVFSLLAIFLLSTRASTGVEVVPQIAIRMPKGSEHHFDAVAPSWKKIENRLLHRPDAFVVLKPNEADPNIKEYWTENWYYLPNAEQKPNSWRRLIRLDPKGRLRLAIDRIGEETFSQEFDANGTLLVYEHRRGFAWIGGVSLDADGKDLARIEQGSGKLLKRNDSLDATEHYFVRDGNLYLFKVLNKEQLLRTELEVGEEHLNIDTQMKSEELYLPGKHAGPRESWTPGENWSKTNGAPPSVRIDTLYIDGDTGKTFTCHVDEDMRLRIQTFTIDTAGWGGSGTKESIEEEKQRRAKDDAAKAAAKAALCIPEYAKLRAAFLERYIKQLKEIGTDIETLSLTEVLKLVQ